MGSALIKEKILNNDYSINYLHDTLPYHDDEFSIQQALFDKSSSSSSNESDKDHIIWLRPKQFATNASLFPKVLALDYAIVSDDCYNCDVSKISQLAAALTGLSVSKANYLYNNLIFYNSNAGVCGVKLWYNEEDVVVIIDDCIPCNSISKKPLFLYSNQEDSCWMPLVLKAMAKLHGSYVNVFKHSNAKEYLHDLTSEIVLYVDVRKWDKVDLFSLIYNKKSGGAIAIAVCNKANCCSLLLSISGDDDDFIVEYYDPCNISIGNDVDSKIRQRMHFIDMIDTIDSMYICITQEKKDVLSKLVYTSKWTIENNGGDVQSHTWRCNPCYRVSIDEKKFRDYKLYINLSVPDKRSTAIDSVTSDSKDVNGNSIVNGYCNYGITLCRDHPLLQVIKHDNSNNRRDASFEVNITDASASSYAVIPSCDNRNVYETFYITIVAIANMDSKKYKLKLSPLSDYDGFHSRSLVTGCWDLKLCNCRGRVGGIDPKSTAYNPCYMMRVYIDKFIDRSRTLRMCFILSVDNIKCNNVMNRTVSYGTYLLTHNFYQRLLHYNGKKVKATDTQFGPNDDGLVLIPAFLSDSIVCHYQEVVVRKKYCTKLNTNNHIDDANSEDYYIDYVVMPVTRNANDEGTFSLEVLTDANKFTLDKIDTNESCNSIRKLRKSEMYKEEHIVLPSLHRNRPSIPPDKYRLIKHVLSTTNLK